MLFVQDSDTHTSVEAKAAAKKLLSLLPNPPQIVREVAETGGKGNGERGMVIAMLKRHRDAAASWRRHARTVSASESTEARSTYQLADDVVRLRRELLEVGRPFNAAKAKLDSLVRRTDEHRTKLAAAEDQHARAKREAARAGTPIGDSTPRLVELRELVAAHEDAREVLSSDVEKAGWSVRDAQERLAGAHRKLSEHVHAAHVEAAKVELLHAIASFRAVAGDRGGGVQLRSYESHSGALMMERHAPASLSVTTDPPDLESEVDELLAAAEARAEGRPHD